MHGIPRDRCLASYGRWPARTSWARRSAAVAGAADADASADDVLAAARSTRWRPAAPASERAARGSRRAAHAARAARRTAPLRRRPEEALAEQLEVRLAALVVAMEDARDAGDDRRADALHARYIELATTYVTRTCDDRLPGARCRTRRGLLRRVGLEPGTGAAPMVSGGADSTLLVVVLAELGFEVRGCTSRTGCVAPSPTTTRSSAAACRCR